MPITFTIDLEDHLGVYASDGRWVQNTQRILAFCAVRQIKATFFTVGRVAPAAPQLLRDIVAGGHELALHSYDHIRLTDEDKNTYGGKLADAKKRFEDLTGAAIKGFRAPQFSLTPASVWAVDVLKEQGFLYSSSVLPGKGAFSGFAGAPHAPFLWPNGLIELPVPVLIFQRFSLPYLGGVYLRYLPLPFVRWCANKQYASRAPQPPSPILWTYTHPYDVDGAEGFVRLKDGTPLWANALLMLGRGGFEKKLAALLQGQVAETLAARAERAEGLPVFKGQG